MTRETSIHLDTAARWIAAADAILIGAGAGLSADAGFDFADRESFAKNYPGLVRQGFHCKLDLMGTGRFAPELEWGYYLANVKEVRFCNPPQPLYAALYEIVGRKDYFVATTNADGLFAKNGFAPERIFTPQGDYARWQCLTPCTHETWPTEPLLDQFLPLVDPQTQWLAAGRYPKCPRCGQAAFLNVRGGDWFVDEPYRAGARRYEAWLQANADKKLVVIEIGAGFNTPMWIRWPSERLVRRNRAARLLRVNLHHPEVPADLGERALSFAQRAGAVIVPLAEAGLDHG